MQQLRPVLQYYSLLGLQTRKAFLLPLLHNGAAIAEVKQSNQSVTFAHSIIKTVE